MLVAFCLVIGRVLYRPDGGAASAPPGGAAPRGLDPRPDRCACGGYRRTRHATRRPRRSVLPGSGVHPDLRPAVLPLHRRTVLPSRGRGGGAFPRTGPFIAVANHNGGPMLPDCWVMAAFWWASLGPERPAYAMVHDAALAVPGLRTFLVRVGGLRGTRANAEKVLRLGAPLLVYPGGELDCLKSFWRRHTIDFHGRTGFIELAMRTGAPILPVVNVGGHEVYLTVYSSQRLARWTGMARLTRVKTLPVNVGLPWGIWVSGFVPY